MATRFLPKDIIGTEKIAKGGMESVERKTYLFASDTDFENSSLTGAHRRFLELLKSVAERADVMFIGRDSATIRAIDNVRIYPITVRKSSFLPKHLSGAVAIYSALVRNKKNLHYDYAISFSPVVSICYRAAGIKHIVSLFREDLIGYKKALQMSQKKIAYFRLQERLAVKASEKIIVQCVNDRNSLIQRNRKYCPDVEQKVCIQINNVNASWMTTDAVEKTDRADTAQILFIGNFSDRRKGHFALLPAAKRLLDEGFRFNLLCAGGGRELEFWKQECNQYPSIRFLDQVKQMKPYLASSDFLIAPSLIDSCPNTILEGLNAGIAVYGAATGGIPDLLQKEAYMFSPDEESIYVFLKNVLTRQSYNEDVIAQREIKKQLSFDWGKKMQELIES